jgi:hypothetical protein
MIESFHCSTTPLEQQVAYIFTKSFTEKKFSKLRAMLGVVETTE